MNGWKIFAVLVLSGVFFLSHSNAAEPDWTGVPSNKMILFYPGAASWEFLLSDDHGLGARNIKDGKKSCSKCHVAETGELDWRADEIASGTLKMKKSQKPFEPEPLIGKKGFMNADLKVSYDDEYMYLRVAWQSIGASWNNPQVAKQGLKDRVAVQLNKGNDYFKRYGCFIACHKNLNSMPEAASKEEVKKHSYYGQLKRDDVRLYAYYTRKNGWDDFKDDKELDKILKQGGLIDLWEASFNGNEIKVEDGSIFEDRKGDDKNDLKVDARWENNGYAVVMKRKLSTNDAKDVQLKDGDEFSIGIAIHDDRANHRKHYVSIPVLIGLGKGGDITASKVK